MTKGFVFLSAACLALGLSQATLAEVGVTDKSQEKARELKNKFDKDTNECTAEARRKAKANPAVANTNRANPAKCRENLRDARQDLHGGKK